MSLPEGTRCGIHGDPTDSGRCASCDAAVWVIVVEDADPAGTGTRGDLFALAVTADDDRPGAEGFGPGRSPVCWTNDPGEARTWRTHGLAEAHRSLLGRGIVTTLDDLARRTAR